MLKRLTSAPARLVAVVVLGLAATACLPTFAPGAGLVVKPVSGSSVRLIWTPASDQDPAHSMTSYAVEANGVVIGTLSPSATNCTVTGLGSGTSYQFSVTAHSSNGTTDEWSGGIGGPVAYLGRLSAGYTTPAGSITPGTIACAGGATDTDGDHLPDWAETNTNVFVDSGDTGTKPNVADTDGDGISDGDETLGTQAGLFLPGMGTNPLHKDLLFEFDWFTDANDCATHSHQPTPAIIARLSAAFAAGSITNPDGTTGVHVIADYGQGLPFTGGTEIADGDGQINVTFEAFGFGGAEFLNLKAANFAANRNGYFHYVLMPHRYNGSSSSGVAELPGDDLIVSLQCFNSTSNVANTIMHEVGHNLNLHHGGTVDTNYKPNYNSIMNYQFQFPGVDTNCVPDGDGVLDYSRGVRNTLNENSLNEAVGICGGVALDWNGNAVLDPPGISVDVNGDGVKQVLTDSNDWTHLSFAGLTDADGARVAPVQSVTEQDVPVSAH